MQNTYLSKKNQTVNTNILARESINCLKNQNQSFESLKHKSNGFDLIDLELLTVGSLNLLR